MPRTRPVLSPPMAVALLALVVALGGTSYAAVTLPRNSVGAVQLKTGAVTSVDVRDRSLRAVDLAVGQLPAGPAGPSGPPGPTGAAGVQGPSGSSAAALVSGMAVVPPFNRAMSLDGRIVSVIAASPHPTESLSPDSPTFVRHARIRMDPAPADGVGRSFDLVVDGVPTRLCSFRGPATGCSQQAGTAVAVPPGALIRVQSLALIGENPLVEATLRWGMAFGTS